MRLILITITLFLSLTVNSQSKTAITKIVIGSGYCISSFGECPIEIIEFDNSLTYSFYTQKLYGESSLSKGTLTLEMWNLFSKGIEKFKSKRFGLKKPFFLSKNSHPAVIQIFRGTKSKTFYADINGLDEEVWKLFEEILNSREKIKLENQDDLNQYITNNKILDFFNSALDEKNYR